MAQMRTVVRATIARIDAEWDAGDLRLCLEALSLSSWQAFARCSSAERTAGCTKLFRKFDKLADACGVTVAQEVVAHAVKLALKEYKALLRQLPEADVVAGTRPDI